MSGLTRFKNLSETGLNLKTSLQKLYAPGIEDDIELFSLSSSVLSTVISGPKVQDPTAEFPVETQIYGLRSEKIVERKGVEDIQYDRTRFLTKYFTFTPGNKVFFKNFSVSTSSNKDSFHPPIFSNNGSIPDVELVYGGRGFYFKKGSSSSSSILHDDNDFENVNDNVVVLKDVILEGVNSKRISAKATLTFKEETFNDKTHATNESYEDFNTRRFTLTDVVITERGTGYGIFEKLRIKETSSSYSVDTELSTLVNTDTASINSLIIQRQGGVAFIFQDPIIRVRQYYYEVINSDLDGFFLFDRKNNKYVFLDKDTEILNIQDIDIRREDFIRVNNFTQFKFASSGVYLSTYAETSFFANGSISSNITSLGNQVGRNLESIRTTIQNAKKPQLATNAENKLGYSYNAFEGRDVAIWQRVIIRDQDDLLGAIRQEGLSGDEVRDNSLIPEFVVTSGSQKFTIPGLYIKVGDVYKRAYSTKDKPFYNTISSVVENPTISTNTSENRNSLPLGTLSAEAYDQSSGSWYAYNSVISEFAQRISVSSPAGKNGAFYFHKSTAITVTEKPNSVSGKRVYSVPLFQAV